MKISIDTKDTDGRYHEQNVVFCLRSCVVLLAAEDACYFYTRKNEGERHKEAFSHSGVPERTTEISTVKEALTANSKVLP
jgi:hypothetical protein